MKTTFHFLVFLSLIFGLIFTSCVSNKKFMASEAQVDKLQKDNAKTLGAADDLRPFHGNFFRAGFCANNNQLHIHNFFFK